MAVRILEEASKLDTLAKIAIVSLSIVTAYILLICIILPAFQSPSMIFSEEYVLSFSSAKHRHLNLISIFGGLVVGCCIAIAIRKRDQRSDKVGIVKSILSEDEKKVIAILEETKEITQDSLMFRLDWSRAKVSTILTNMEKRNIVQRRREGKTYNVFLSKGLVIPV